MLTLSIWIPKGLFRLLFSSRHERPNDPDDPLSEQNIRDRYYGNNDPVAEKLMKRAKEMPALEPPEDPMITTLYVAGLTDDQSKSVIDPVSETDLRNHFYQVCNNCLTLNLKSFDLK